VLMNVAHLFCQRFGLLQFLAMHSFYWHSSILCLDFWLDEVKCFCFLFTICYCWSSRKHVSQRHMGDNNS
jgi:hypothetical protein